MCTSRFEQLHIWISNPKFDSATPKEQIIFVNLVQKNLEVQNDTSGPPMCTERVLKGNVKAEFLQWINFIVANFTKVMATMTVHIFSTYANHNKRQFKQRYLRKPHKTKA